DTWRKAAVVVGSRLPTEEEEAFLAIEGDLGLEVLLDELLTEQAFIDWVKEVYNDQLLTDRYLLPGQDGEQRALNLLSTADFPNLFWYNSPTVDTDMSLLAQAASQTNRAVAREALELIGYVVRNDRPFSEILTADYMVVNPWSANSYGVSSQVTFDDPYDPNEFREAKVDGYPHAGVLTSAMFLNRFPTSATNVNRHRARVVYEFFLATDTLKLAERPVDPTEIESHNPTMFNPACSVCHSNIDPVGGCFQNWTEGGRYMPPEQGWHTDMLPPGFGDAEVPNDQHTKSLQWLANTITKDPRFAKAAIYIMYQGLTGQKPITLPTLEDESGPTTPTYDNRMVAHDAQQEFFQQVMQQYADGDEQLRVVVKALILSPWFRAENYQGELTPEREVQLERMGTSRLLTPELLDRKVEATTGLPWRESPNSPRKLLTSADYLIFYGGINSDDVTRRITDPNGLMGSVAQRLANEMSCRGITGDLIRSPQERKLLPYVSASYAPEDANGFVVQVAVDAIRENIRFLHWKITGERLAPDSETLNDTYELFYDVWYEGREAVWNGDEPSSLPQPCQLTTDPITGQPLPAAKHITHDPDYTIRAWMAVTTYLMSDYRFLYE
ncbi:MAG: hypothetical protein VX938_04370, partial [Myxococcota bacterium]|nr:hypothetical protein [Myxococcota bacterium]